jgi:hypothetical protein
MFSVAINNIKERYHLFYLIGLCNNGLKVVAQ